MKVSSMLFLGASLLLVGSRLAPAQTLSLSASGSPATMTITSIPAAGAQPNFVTNSTTSYVVTAKQSSPQKITAQLNAPMPTGVTLTATFSAVTGATSSGPVNLDATARNVVTGIDQVTGKTGTITYKLSATVSAGVVPVQTRIVTLTLTNFP
jgi:hypothetical protein